MRSSAAGSFRLTIRTALAGLVTVLGAFAVSCQGSNCGTISSPAPLSISLGSLYLLGSVDGRFLPTKYADSAAFQLRVSSDTLRLSLTDSVYHEAGLVSRLDPSTGTEVTSTYVLAGTPRITRVVPDVYSFPKFLGGSATATATPGVGHALLTLVTPGGQTWVFNSGSP
jgi:hypothetical protein